MPGSRSTGGTGPSGSTRFSPFSGKERKTYHVAIDGVSHNMETTDSFAIKFSLLLNVPLSRVKHVIRKKPSIIWSGSSKSRAESILSLISEAGGIGRIIEEGKAESVTGGSPDVDKDANLCRKCGFPLKKDVEFCGFCMTSLSEIERKAFSPPVKKALVSISPERLLFYLLIIFALTVVSIVLR